ncbi:hypothetical protein LguiB_022302 [Lonicera macranthoides]
MSRQCTTKIRYVASHRFLRAFVFPAAISTVKKLSQNSLGHALELVMKAKSSVTNEYVRSVADLMVTRGRPPVHITESWLVSDNTRAGYRDRMWISGGAKRNNKGENVAVVPICLPAAAMERSVKVLGSMLAGNDQLVNAMAFSQKSAL